MKTKPAATSSATSSRSALCSLAASVGLLLIAVGTLIPILNGAFPHSPLYKYLCSAGAVVCLVGSLFDRLPEGTDLRRRRWKRIEGWSSIFFVAGAVFLWIPGSSPRDWLAFTLAGAVIRIIVFFTSLRNSQKTNNTK